MINMVDMVLTALILGSLAVCLAGVLAFTLMCPPAGLGTIAFAIYCYRKVK